MSNQPKPPHDPQLEQEGCKGSASPNCSRVEDAVVEMIRSRGRVGRRKYRTTMDRRDLHPDEWVRHHQEELADALQYAERLKGMAELLHIARHIMMTLLHERDWECAQEWVDRYHEHFFPENARAVGSGGGTSSQQSQPTNNHECR